MERQNSVKSYYLKDTKFNRIALAQVYEIICGYEEEKEKIPQNIIKFLYDNMDKQYIFDYGDDLENFQLERDAENLIIYIYAKYIATEEERKTIEDMAQMQYMKKQKELQKQYQKDIFDSKEKNIQENILPVEYKESVFKKIIRYFENLFKRK